MDICTLTYVHIFCACVYHMHLCVISVYICVVCIVCVLLYLKPYMYIHILYCITANRGQGLRRSGGMDKATILEFFEGCNSMSMYIICVYNSVLQCIITL